MRPKRDNFRHDLDALSLPQNLEIPWIYRDFQRWEFNLHGSCETERTYQLIHHEPHPSLPTRLLLDP